MFLKRNRNVLLPLPFTKLGEIRDFKNWKTRWTDYIFHCCFSHAVGITIFELLAHDGACWCGDVVRGVLLGIGRCDDGHQVVSVRWVNLKKKIKKTRHRDLDWFHCRNVSLHLTHVSTLRPPNWMSRAISHPRTEKHHKTKGLPHTHAHTGYIPIHSTDFTVPSFAFVPQLIWGKEESMKHIVKRDVLPAQISCEVISRLLMKAAQLDHLSEFWHQ